MHSKIEKICFIVEKLADEPEKTCTLLKRSIIGLVPLIIIFIIFSIFILLDEKYPELFLVAILGLSAVSTAIFAGVNREFESIHRWKLRVQEAAFVAYFPFIAGLMFTVGTIMGVTSYPWKVPTYPRLILSMFSILMGVLVIYVSMENGFSIMKEFRNAPELFVLLRRRFNGEKGRIVYHGLRVQVKRIDGEYTIVIFHITEENTTYALEIMNFADSL